MAAVITYALPTVLLVCCLVATGNSNPVDTNSGTIGATSQSPSSALPTGYEVYSNFSVAYKIHRESLTWSEARDACIREGAHLAEIDSYEKADALWMQLESLTYTSIHLANGTWRSVNTGLTVANIPWARREPWKLGGPGGCALMKYYESGSLGEFSCTQPRQYICEIPYPARQSANLS